MNHDIHPSGWQARRRPCAKRCAVIVAAAALSTITVSPIASAHASVLPALTCSDHTLNVHIADPGPRDQTMWGQLCYRGNHEPTTVQLLVHGATYNHLY